MLTETIKKIRTNEMASIVAKEKCVQKNSVDANYSGSSNLIMILKLIELKVLECE